MKDKKDYPLWIDAFHAWIKDVKNHEIKDLAHAFSPDAMWWQALTHLSIETREKFDQLLKQELFFFYQQKHHDPAVFFDLKETLWYELSEMTDRSQLEWHSLLDDFQHDGLYQQGDWVAVGIIECADCGKRTHSYHLTQVTSCVDCGGRQFRRKPLAP